jgi:hypothetical protein
MPDDSANPTATGQAATAPTGQASAAESVTQEEATETSDASDQN